MSKTMRDKPPGGVLRLGLRLPIWLYRAHLGRLLDDRFLMLTHIGRMSGKPRQVVLEVVSHDRATDTYVVASGWGERSNWFRNIQKTPDVAVSVGRRRFGAVAVHLSIDQAERVLADYAGRHPLAFAELSHVIIGRRLENTAEDIADVAQRVPLVALERRQVADQGAHSA